jgi:uncharacterized membrane protein
MKQAVLIFTLVYFVLVPTAWAQETYEELQAFVAAEVVAIEDERIDKIYGTDASTTVQTVRALLKDGIGAGSEVVFENDMVMLKAGDEIYLNHVRTINGQEIYFLKDVNRKSGLLYLSLLFVGLLLIFARGQGVRALLSLGLSIAAILWLLVPALLAGYDPVLVSLLISGIILAVVLFGTHGFNALSTVAFSGTFLAVLFTSAVALIFVGSLRLNGFGAEASVALNFATNGRLDFAGLLLGSIIIGILGVLDDVAITQASVVQELKAANHNFKIWDLYQRGIKVGRDHVGSLINTLALAYVGASLPLVLLFSTSEAPVLFTLNQEVIASEIARIIVGSIGLVLAVPFTTLIAAWWFANHSVDDTHNSSHSHHHH